MSVRGLNVSKCARFKPQVPNSNEPKDAGGPSKQTHKRKLRTTVVLDDAHSKIGSANKENAPDPSIEVAETKGVAKRKPARGRKTVSNGSAGVSSLSDISSLT